MIVDCVSDLHGSFPQLEGGDLLLIAGDITADDSPIGWINFYKWLELQNYRKKIFIAGNHDNYLNYFDSNDGFIWTYLKDDFIEFDGLKIWGSPWTAKFHGQNPKAMAFALFDDTHLSAKWDLIPDDTDILITHCPPYGYLDKARRWKFDGRTIQTEHLGSATLRNAVLGRVKPKLHVFGHIHLSHGKTKVDGTIFVNAAHMNEDYEPINSPIRIEL